MKTSATLLFNEKSYSLMLHLLFNVYRRSIESKDGKQLNIHQSINLKYKFFKKESWGNFM